MFGKKRSTKSASLEERITQLESSRDYLKRELMKVSGDLERLKSRQAATVQFYEYRLDQIYHKVLKRLPLVEQDIGHTSRGLMLESEPDWERLIFEARDSLIRPGRIASPLTLSGFRIDTRRAIERLDHIELMPRASGIAVFGPYRKLVPGCYSVRFDLEAVGDGAKVLIEAFTSHEGNDQVVGSTEFQGYGPHADLAFEWPVDLSEAAVEFRIHQQGEAGVKLTAVDITYMQSEPVNEQEVQLL